MHMSDLVHTNNKIVGGIGQTYELVQVGELGGNSNNRTGPQDVEVGVLSMYPC